jgi:hypothetical protein
MAHSFRAKVANQADSRKRRSMILSHRMQEHALNLQLGRPKLNMLDSRPLLVLLTTISHNACPTGFHFQSAYLIFSSNVSMCINVCSQLPRARVPLIAGRTTLSFGCPKPVFLTSIAMHPPCPRLGCIACAESPSRATLPLAQVMMGTRS